LRTVAGCSPIRRFAERAHGRLLGGSYELLLGRRAYEIFAAYWPHNADQPLGETFNAVREHVVTSSDRLLTWNNGQRVLGHPAEARSWTLVEQAHSPRGVHFASFARDGEVRTGSFATKPPSQDELTLRRRQVEGRW
jgi:hypothetical protein